jgi:cytosine deaminase
MEEVYDMITVDAARALGINNFDMKAGNPANLVVLTQESVWKALWEHEAPMAVIKDGKDVTLVE